MLSNITLENVFFIIKNDSGQCDGHIIGEKLKNSRITNCRVFRDSNVDNDEEIIYLEAGSSNVIISGMLNTGNGYFNIGCADETVVNNCVFNGNHKTRLSVGVIGNGRYTVI